MLIRDLGALIIVCGLACSSACARTDRRAPNGQPTLAAPECHITAPACRIGCDVDEPRRVVYVPPDLSGLDRPISSGVEIAEMRLDEIGAVTDMCLRRGVRPDVDARAIAAFRQWRFEPARLRHATRDIAAGAALPIVITVSLSVGR